MIIRYIHIQVFWFGNIRGLMVEAIFAYTVYSMVRI